MLRVAGDAESVPTPVREDAMFDRARFSDRDPRHRPALTEPGDAVISLLSSTQGSQRTRTIGVPSGVSEFDAQATVIDQGRIGQEGFIELTSYFVRLK
jgi:hypothetical protein